MITEAVMSFLAGVAGFMVDLVPEALRVPPFMDATFQAMFGLIAAAVGLSTWVPIASVFAAIAWRLSLIMGLFGVKFVRMLVSLATGGGGSAA